MSKYPTARFEQAVAAICPDIAMRVASRRPESSERGLWAELSTCLLSSQVPYPLAVAAAEALDRTGVLHDQRMGEDELFEKIARILRQPLLVAGRRRSYRFPTARARQLAASRAEVTRFAGNLQPLLLSFGNGAAARAWFVANLPGIGPKQASMFLRNCGVSYDLAILDRHVLNYMAALSIQNELKPFRSGLAQYCRYEVRLRSYANEMGFPVGLLDWAIWIVMRVASRKDLEIAVP
jgi:N-glycosylase/DNA lyase